MIFLHQKRSFLILGEFLLEKFKVIFIFLFIFFNIIFFRQGYSNVISNNIVIPKNFYQVNKREVKQDNVSAILTRFERRDKINSGLGGEHISTLVSKNGKFLGFVEMSLGLSNQNLPSKENAEKIARNYLSKTAPDLLSNMQITSIESYSKPLKINKNTVKNIVGMRVKARNKADGSWFWVVIGSNNRPIAFERDVGWSYLLFKRSSEYWLDDTWLVNHK